MRNQSIKIYPKRNQGFTLIELSLVMGIIAILTGFVSINLLKPQVTASVASSTQTFAADLKEQQIKAMVGDTEGTGATQAFGVHIEADGYTLFRGTSFSPSDPANFTVNLEDGLALSTSLPLQQIVFIKGSGEVSGYTPGADTITISHTQGGEQKVVTVNRYSAITIN